ncbi:hypothetical protein F383_16031 [Gossypium arboreum]|uniref:Uncharacterized protein n=1 Tax=Gossypium arboreum TaxID=29729 RepID=A0A0B0PVF8_GOSAR|nr:hypothetical protein F383_16031 [Gossypium arboreum]
MARQYALTASIWGVVSTLPEASRNYCGARGKS